MPQWKSPRRDDTLHVYADVSQSNHQWLGFVERLPRPDHRRPWRGVVYNMNGDGEDGHLFFDTCEEAKSWVEVIVRMTN